MVGHFLPALLSAFGGFVRRSLEKLPLGVISPQTPGIVNLAYVAGLTESSAALCLKVWWILTKISH